MRIPQLNDKDMTELVNARRFVLVKFSAPWCGPCKALAPVFEAAAERHPEVAFAEINVDEHPAIAARFSVRSLPTLMGWVDGDPTLTRMGLLSAEGMDKLVADLAHD